MTRCHWKTTRIPRGFRRAALNATQLQQSLSSAVASRRSPRTNHTQYYPPVSIPTPTPQRNMHLISYAQPSLEIVFRCCKRSLVRQAFTGTQQVASSFHSSLCLFPALHNYSFAQKSQFMPTEWVSPEETERRRISVTIWATDRVSQRGTAPFCPHFSLHFLQASVQLSNPCHYLTVIYLCSKKKKTLYVSFLIVTCVIYIYIFKKSHFEEFPLSFCHKSVSH